MDCNGARICTSLGVFFLTLLLASCGGTMPGPTPIPPPPKNCRGDACIYWTATQGASCVQYNPGKKNLAYTARSSSSSLTLPITVFLKLEQKDPTGAVVYTSPEQAYQLGTISPFQLPICTVAVYHPSPNTDVIVTQRLFIACVTNRTLPNGATSANCASDELSTKVVDFNTSLKQPSLTNKLNDGQTIYAATAFSALDKVDCSVVCSPSGTGECLRVRSTDLKAKLFNTLQAWKPGQPVDKQKLMAAADIPTDKCSRDASVVSADGKIANKGKYCALDFDTDGQKTRLEILPSILGEVADDIQGHKVLFKDPVKAPQLKIDGDAAIYGGAVMAMASPLKTSAIDVRTEAMCIRVYAH
jgi:hypothetical protein